MTLYRRTVVYLLATDYLYASHIKKKSSLFQHCLEFKKLMIKSKPCVDRALWVRRQLVLLPFLEILLPVTLHTELLFITQDPDEVSTPQWSHSPPSHSPSKSSRLQKRSTLLIAYMLMLGSYHMLMSSSSSILLKHLHCTHYIPGSILMALRHYLT